MVEGEKREIGIGALGPEPGLGSRGFSELDSRVLGSGVKVGGDSGIGAEVSGS